VKLEKEDKVMTWGRGTGRLEEEKCPLLNLMGISINGPFVHLEK